MMEPTKAKKRAGSSSIAQERKRAKLLDMLKLKLSGRKDEEQKGKGADADELSSDEGNQPELESGGHAKTIKSGFAKGNKMAAKGRRKVELGWIHEGFQRRSQTGGSARKISLSKEAKAEDIKREAVNLFFPEGKSKRGLDMNELDLEICDFSLIKIPESQTVGEAYEKEKPSGILRYYLATTLKEKPEVSSPSDGVASCSHGGRRREPNKKKKTPGQKSSKSSSATTTKEKAARTSEDMAKTDKPGTFSPTPASRQNCQQVPIESQKTLCKPPTSKLPSPSASQTAGDDESSTTIIPFGNVGYSAAVAMGTCTGQDREIVIQEHSEPDSILSVEQSSSFTGSSLCVLSNGSVASDKPALEIQYFRTKQSRYSEVSFSTLSTTSRRQCSELTKADKNWDDPRSLHLDSSTVAQDPLELGFQVGGISKGDVCFVQRTPADAEGSRFKYEFPAQADKSLVILHGPNEVWGHEDSRLVLGMVSQFHNSHVPYQWVRNGVPMEGSNACIVVVSQPGAYYCQLNVRARNSNSGEVSTVLVQSDSVQVVDFHNGHESQSTYRDTAKFTETTERGQDSGNGKEVTRRDPGTCTESTGASSETTYLRLHRGHILQELMKYYHSNTVKEGVQIQLILPNGKEEAAEDRGGVFRDVLTEFWEDFYELFTVGENLKVPAVRHNVAAEDWEACAKVLAVGFIQTGYFPVRLAYPFLDYVMFGEAALHSDDLTEAFLEYIPETDKRVVQEALNHAGPSFEYERLQETLQAYGLRVDITEKNFKSVLLQVSHAELIQEPAYIAKCWHHVFVQDFQPHMPRSFKELQAVMEPTTKTVVDHVVFPEMMTDAERVTKGYLVKYIKGLTSVGLRNFLRFSTGSNVMSTEQIRVNFVHQTEFCRRPTARCCGCVLELSDNFKNYMDFRSEFNKVLDAKVWVMDLV